MLKWFAAICTLTPILSTAGAAQLSYEEEHKWHEQVVDAAKREWKKVPRPNAECIEYRVRSMGNGIRSLEDLAAQGIFPDDDVMKPYKGLCAFAYVNTVPPSSVWGFPAPNL